MKFKYLLRTILLLTNIATLYAQDTILNSIVKIYCDYNTPDYYQPWRMHGKNNRTGSGCIIKGNRILTNAHIVSDQTFIRVRRAGKAEKYTANIGFVAHDIDLALLEVEDSTFFTNTTPLEFGSLPDVGETVVSYGFPKGGTRITITRGVISRIDRKRYIHSYLDNLTCQIDASINPGSSGGPIISQGVIVGVAFQSRKGNDIGYMIPIPVINHFFSDIEDGTYDGIPGFPISWQNLENKHQRIAYRMSEHQTGVLVTQVFKGLIDSKKIHTEDVILSIDGYVIANDGTIELRKGTRIPFMHLIDRCQLGDEIVVSNLHKGKLENSKIMLNKPARICRSTIPLIAYECQPSYFIYAGLVFSPLTTNLLREWGQNWITLAPRNMLRYFFENPDPRRKEIIVLIQNLSDEVNVGYDRAKYSIVTTVNGKKITGMKKLIQAFSNNKSKVHKIQTENNKHVLILPVEGGIERNKRIIEKYKIGKDRSDDLAN